jgi:hypothetical protein
MVSPTLGMEESRLDRGDWRTGLGMSSDDRREKGSASSFLGLELGLSRMAIMSTLQAR